MQREIIPAAINVLNARVIGVLPDPAEVEVLRRFLGVEAGAQEPEELARIVIERYLYESRLVSRAAG